MFARLLLVLLLCGSAVQPWAGYLLRVAIGVLMLTSAEGRLGAQGPGEDFDKEFAKQMLKTMRPNDPDGETRRAKLFGQSVLPRAEERAGWKSPWEMPEGFVFHNLSPLRANLNKPLQKQTEEDYWKQLGEGAGFVGLKHDDATKKIDDFLVLFEKLGAQAAGVKKRQLLLLALAWPGVVHKSSPTLAIVWDQGAALAAHMKQAGPLKKAKDDKEDAERMIGLLEAREPALKNLSDDELKERVIRDYTLNQKFTQMLYFRSNNWGELTRLLAASRVGELLGRDANGSPWSFDRACHELNVRSCVALLTVRMISADAESLKRVADDDKKAQATLERKVQGLLGRLGTIRVRTDPNFGEFSYVLSLAVTSDNKEAPRGLMRAASLRTGVCIADIEIFSTMSEAETDNDVNFFLGLMHTKTLIGRLEKDTSTGSDAGK